MSIIHLLTIFVADCWSSVRLINVKAENYARFRYLYPCVCHGTSQSVRNYAVNYVYMLLLTVFTHGPVIQIVAVYRAHALCRKLTVGHPLQVR